MDEFDIHRPHARARYSKVKLSLVLPPYLPVRAVPVHGAPHRRASVTKGGKIGQPKVALLSRFEDIYQDWEVLLEEGLVGEIVSKQ